MSLAVQTVQLEVPHGSNIILGQAHFIKTAEDLYEIVATTVPQATFGIAFAEASGPCLIRTEGNDAALISVAAKNLQTIGAGHLFCIIIKNAYPINILNQVKNCPEVCRVFAATANPLQAIVVGSEQGKGVIGVIDGFSCRGVEEDADRENRRTLLRTIGYKR